MKTIKTYEGFFDFLNKKEKKEVTLDDIRECLYDLADESRIKNQLNGVRLDGIFASNVFKKDLFSFTDDLVNKPSYIEKNFMITGNVITFNFIYNPNEEVQYAAVSLDFHTFNLLRAIRKYDSVANLYYEMAEKEEGLNENIIRIKDLLK